jgi:UDPglucose 6-dehydrogenase
MMNVTMIGLGKLGLPVAEVMAEKHFVKGYDIDTTIKNDKIKICQSLYNACVDSEIIFIAVPTPHDPAYGGEAPSSELPTKDFDYQYLKDTLKSLVEIAPKDAMIVNISTVLPGTLRPMITELGIGDRFVYNPYLIAMGTVTEDFLAPDIMMLGFQSWPHPEYKTKADKLIEFYKTVQTKREPHTTLGTWEEAECIKIFHNTYISAKVGIANMVQDVTMKIGHSNPSVVAESLRHADRIVSEKYMEPGMGDGGPCHPRDNIALSWLAEKIDLGYDLFKSIMQAREIQAENVAKELIRHNLPVHILGKSFKPETNLTDGSTSMLVGHYVEQAGHKVVYDHVSVSPAVYLLAHPVDYSSVNFAEGSVIVDMYRKYQTHWDKIKVVHYGVR